MGVSECPHCGSEDYIKAGFRYGAKSWSQQYQCKRCHRYFLGKPMPYGPEGERLLSEVRS